MGVLKPIMNIDREVRRMRRAISSIIERAKKLGIERPEIYIESSGELYVIDGDHPNWCREKASASAQQEAIVGSAHLTPYGVKLDVGAW